MTLTRIYDRFVNTAANLDKFKNLFPLAVLTQASKRATSRGILRLFKGEEEKIYKIKVRQDRKED